MSSTKPSDSLTLFESNQLILNELQAISKSLNQLYDQNKTTNSQLADLIYLLNGFTSGGASLSGYIPDTFTTSYLSILGPVLATRLTNDDIGLEEMMKGATMLAKTMLEELSAYRGEQEGRDLLADRLAFMEDPWKKEE